jgi:cell division septation protein DedD
LGALKSRGYHVYARAEAQDKLIHIQVGPFSSHADADAMRQRLLADGYNAIVK